MTWRISTVVGLGGLVLTVGCVHDSPGPGQVACTTHGTDIALAVASYQQIDPASDSGCVNFPANASTIDSAEYLVLPWSAAGTPILSAPFSLVSETPAASIEIPQMASSGAGSHGTAAAAFDYFLRGMARSRRYPIETRLAAAPATAPLPSTTAGPPTVGSVRTFKVCSNFTCSTFASVGARVQSVGLHIAIYVDTTAPSPGLATADFDSLRQVFDTRLYPIDTVTFGHVSDIDSNTVAIVLMTGVVNKLVTKARCHSSGYIAGFFFSGDLDPIAAPQFNNGEIFYSIVADPDSTLSCAHSAQEVIHTTPVTFTHEFQHMINFVEHVRVKSGDAEEGWLDEGLSKYAEEIAGRSYLAQGDTATFSSYAIGSVYDAYQFLLDPGSSPLLIPEDTGSLAEVGASWLFVRYIVDQFGDSLPGKLVQSNLTGAANVAAKTGQPFDQTIGRWALANYVSDLAGFAAPPELQYTTWHFHRTFGSLHTQDPSDFPRAYPLVPPVLAGSGVNLSGTLHSGSGEYVRAVQGPGGAGFTLHFSGPGGALLPGTIVPRLVVARIR